MLSYSEHNRCSKTRVHQRCFISAYHRSNYVAIWDARGGCQITSMSSTMELASMNRPGLPTEIDACAGKLKKGRICDCYSDCSRDNLAYQCDPAIFLCCRKLARVRMRKVLSTSDANVGIASAREAVVTITS